MSLIWAPAQLAVLAKVVDLNGFSSAAPARWACPRRR